MMIIEDNYDEKIRGEADYWSKEALESLRYGTPQWVDYRLTNKLTTLPRHVNELQYDIELWKIFRGHLVNHMIKLITHNQGKKVLDLVCGAGWLSLELARNGLNVTGMDISDKMLHLARENQKNNPFNSDFGSLRYVKQDLNKVILPNNNYDYVVAFDGLHHVLKIERLMAEVKNSLKPNGKLIVYDHVGPSLIMLIVNQMIRSGIFLLIPQTSLNFSEKIKFIYNRIYGKIIKPKLLDRNSPFEDAGAKEMMGSIESNFQLSRIESTLSLFQIGSSVANCNISRRKKIKICKIIAKVDNYLINKFKVKGEYIYLEGHPQ